MKAIEIAHKEFPTGFVGGYQREAVREYLSRVADLVDELHSQLQAARQQVDHLKTEAGRAYRDETTIARVMLSADQLASRLKQEAEADIQMTREMAVREAERIRLQAQSEAETILARAKAEMQRLEYQAAGMRSTLTGTVEQAYEMLVTSIASLQNVRDLGIRFAGIPGEAEPAAAGAAAPHTEPELPMPAPSPAYGPPVPDLAASEPLEPDLAEIAGTFPLLRADSDEEESHPKPRQRLRLVAGASGFGEEE